MVNSLIKHPELQREALEVTKKEQMNQQQTNPTRDNNEQHGWIFGVNYLTNSTPKKGNNLYNLQQMAQINGLDQVERLLNH